MPKAKKPAATKETTPEPVKAPVRKDHFFYANGKRKSAVALVRLYENGKGDITVNEKPATDYFFGVLIGKIKSPLKLTNTAKMFDVVAQVKGGGVPAQADALRHGISKALTTFDPALRSVLKKAGFITRDSRVKERKKYGLHRARKAPQWAKR